MRPADFTNGNFSANARHVPGRNYRGNFPGVPRQPCHGLQCRQQPLVPPAPLPSTSSPQQKACLIEKAVPMLPIAHVLILDAALRHDKLCKSPIERPPKRCS
jgi:hypothetical protein